MSIVTVTSFIFIGVTFLGFASSLYIDIVINIACVLLMHKTNEIFYKKLCKIFHQKIYKCCLNYIDRHRSKDGIMEQIEI